MDSFELAHIFDAISGGTCADRFLTSLSTTPPPPPQPELPLSPHPFDIPLLSSPPLSPSPPPLPAATPLLDTHHPLPFFSADCNLPVSAVTDPGLVCRSPSPHTPKFPVHVKKEPILTSTTSLPPPSLPPPSLPSPVPPNPSTKRPRAPVNIPTKRRKREPVIKPVPSPVVTPPPKSHTRKCREKVTRQFQNLLHVLPWAPPGVEIKHKAQILEYTIRVFRHLLSRRTCLRAEIALASKPALRQWMNTTISSMSSPLQRHSAHSPPIQEQGGPPVPFGVVLEAFVRLYCVKKAWRYGEVWLVQSSHSQSHSALHYTAAWTSCVLNSEDGDVRERLASFSAASSRRYGTPNKLQSGMVSRVIACGRPEWLNDLACDPAVFSRADVIQPNSLCVAEAVPVMLEGKHCAAVLLFADEKPHTFSTTDVHVLLDYASTLAHCYLQYVNNLQEGRFGLSNDTSGTNGLQQQQQVHTAGVCADVGDGTNPLSSSAVSCDRQVGGDNHSMLNLPHDIVLPLSETSSAYFADSDFLGAC